MTPIKIMMKDWHIPFMLFELSSYAQSKRLKNQPYPEDELATEIKNFFRCDNEEESMDFIWDNLKIGED